MRRGEAMEQRLRSLVRQRWAADFVAFVSLGLAVAGLGLLVAASFYWAGWVVWLFLVPMVPVAWLLAAQNRFRHVCGLVEQEFEPVRGRLIAALELARFPAQSREGYSADMIDAAVDEVEHALAPLPLGRLVNWRRPVWMAGLLVVSLLALAAFVRLSPDRARVGLANVLDRSRLGVEFVVLPGDTAVLPGAMVTLQCRVRPSRAFATVRLERSGKEASAKVVQLAGDTCRVVVAAGSGFRYRFSVLGVRSDEFRLRVLEPVALNRLAFTYHYPEYSRLPEQRSSSPDVSALKGTVVDVEGEANRLLHEGRLLLGADTLALAIDPKDSSRFTGRFTVKADMDGAIELADPDDRLLQAAQKLTVRALADEPPFVKLFMPGRDVDLPVSMQVPLGVNTLDDYGLGELYLHFGKESIDQRIRLKSLAGKREDTTLYRWDMTDIGLLPGEVMRYFVSVTDNDIVSGPKVSRSEVFSVQFPTMTEIYSAAVQQTERTASELGPMQSEQAQLGEELARVSEELKKNRELSWDEKQALQKTLSGQEGLMQQVAELKQEVEQMMQDLSSGMMLDKETMDRMGQLQQLLSEMLPRELQQSLAELRRKLEQQSPDTKRALEKFQLDQEKMKQAIDRALELLKKIAEEQRLEELARKADELAEAQEKLTEKLGREPSEQSSEMEKDIKEGLDSLQQEMKDLADSLSDKEVGDSLAALADGAEQEKLSDRANELANQMQQGKAGESKPKSGKLAQDMKKLSSGLKSLSQQLKKKRSSDIARKLGSAAGDLLMVSEEQEKLEVSLPGRTDLPDMAAQQMGLQDAARVVAESLSSLASQSMGVPPQLGQELAKAMNSMEQAAQAMANSNSFGAQQGMSASRVSLNRTVRSLLEAMADAQQGGGMSGGMEAMMQALSQMSADQMSINGEMGGMPIPIPGGMSAAQMAALSRILARQRALREQLQQMMDDMGGTQPGLSGSLEGLLEEMKSVEKDLAELNVSRKLIERQESILAHLLDTQRSMRQQGFKEERQSESGKEFQLLQRPSLPEDRGERNRMLREELMRALKQGYPPEYEKLIRAYFEKLLAEP
jgi:hypothetical protein